MVRAHFRKPSSTFSPVRALVSRNTSSEERRANGATRSRKGDVCEQGGGERRGWTSGTVLLGEARRLQEGHLSVGVQVLLVAAQDDHDVGARQSPGVRQPVGQRVISPILGDDGHGPSFGLEPAVPMRPICSLTVFPPTLTTLEPNSTPMVWLESCLTAAGTRREESETQETGC
ncbi:hypothetical protein EYF80_034963 [Liparis tanakae]|uniref:Uncharacterized protein n=1 Tax=Liparis tanakae TaxID=230148 RepID=A0A4Z2GPX8_9TELE|nr:hypothetical protein EYF80_034963 [Liparis tanakae]